MEVMSFASPHTPPARIVHFVAQAGITTGLNPSESAEEDCARALVAGVLLLERLLPELLRLSCYVVGAAVLELRLSCGIGAAVGVAVALWALP